MPAAAFLMNLGFAGSVSAVAGPTITTTSIPEGTVGERYSETLEASGAATPFTWSITNGSLPEGFELLSDGTIQGTPATAGSATFTVQVEDTNSNTDTQVLTLVVGPAVDPQIFGVWERLPLVFGGSARDTIRVRESVSGRVVVPGEIASRVAFTESAFGAMAVALQGGFSERLDIPGITSCVESGIMPNRDLEDIAALVGMGVIDTRIGFMLLAEELSHAHTS